MNVISSVIKKDYQPYLNQIFSRAWIVALLFLPFFKPASLESLSGPFLWADMLLTAAKAGFFLLACLFYLGNKKISAFLIVTAVFNLLFLISTYVNQGDLKKALIYVINIIGVCILTELAVKFSFPAFLKAVFYLLSGLLVLHLISQFVFPNGIVLTDYYSNACYFMGIDNRMAPYLFLELLVTILYSEFFYRRITWPALGMLAVVSLIILKSWSASALVGWAIFVLFLVLFYRRKLGRFFQFGVLSAAYIVIFVSFVVLRLQNLLSFIIVDVLHKDLTFTHRTEFWDVALSHIRDHWLLGMGVPWEKGHVWSDYYLKFYNGHNIVLELLLVGGSLLLIAFLAVLFFCGRRVMSARPHPWASLVSAVLFSFFMVMLLETYYYEPPFWIMLAIAYQLPVGILQQEAFEQQHPEFGKRKGLSLKIYQSYCTVKNEVIRRKH